MTFFYAIFVRGEGKVISYWYGLKTFLRLEEDSLTPHGLLKLQNVLNLFSFLLCDALAFKICSKILNIKILESMFALVPKIILREENTDILTL